jgi:hypothetical protein
MAAAQMGGRKQNCIIRELRNQGAAGKGLLGKRIGHQLPPGETPTASRSPPRTKH